MITKIKRLHLRPWMVVLVVLLLGLSACTGQQLPTEVFTVVETPAEISSAPASPENTQPKQLDSGAEPDTGPAEPTPVLENPATEDGAGAVPSTSTPDPSTPAAAPREFTPSDDPLRASDPGSFRLASGEVQLVEFFAFW
jgi:hypothetical protein